LQLFERYPDILRSVKAKGKTTGINTMAAYWKYEMANSCNDLGEEPLWY